MKILQIVILTVLLPVLASANTSITLWNDVIKNGEVTTFKVFRADYDSIDFPSTPDAYEGPAENEKKSDLKLKLPGVTTIKWASVKSVLVNELKIGTAKGNPVCNFIPGYAFLLTVEGSDKRHFELRFCGHCKALVIHEVLSTDEQDREFVVNARGKGRVFLETNPSELFEKLMKP